MSSPTWNTIPPKRTTPHHSSTTKTPTSLTDDGWQIAGSNANTRREEHVVHDLSFTTPFTLWTFSKSQMQSYDTSLKKLCTFSSLPQFWHFYQYLFKPSQINEHLTQKMMHEDGSGKVTFPGRDLQCFREGIKPAWEDPANRNGGKWMIRIKKEYSDRLWEELLLAFVGEQLSIGITGRSPQDDVQEVCGIVLSVREHDIISVWNRNAHDYNARERLRDRIKNVLHLPVGTVMEYKPHQVVQQKSGDGYARPQVETYRVTYRDNRRSQRGGRQHYGGSREQHGGGQYQQQQQQK